MWSTYETVVERHLGGLIGFGLRGKVSYGIVSCSKMSVDVGRLLFSNPRHIQSKNQCFTARIVQSALTRVEEAVECCSQLQPEV
jgi:hypothetical protein